MLRKFDLIPYVNSYNHKMLKNIVHM